MLHIETDREHLEKRISEEIGKISAQLKIPSPDTSMMVKEALLRSDAFLRTRKPIIAVAGITHTGKSSLINALFGEKMLTEGLTADETALIMTVRFNSGLLLYDTPGCGGTEAGYENVTRAFLGLPQLDKDVWGNPVVPLTRIPTADASSYNKQIDAPKSQLEQTDFEAIDLILFVISVEASLRGEDVRFFQDVASCKPPVIVVINKIDLAEEEKVKANVELIRRKLARQAIPISAHTGIGMDTLAVAIQHALPLECTRTLGETVDTSYKQYLRQRQIEVDSLIAAVMTAQVINPSTHEVNDDIEYAANILGLYGLIVRQYALSEHQLGDAGLDVKGLWQGIGNKMENAGMEAGTITPAALVGLAFGGLAATVASGGFVMLPFALGIAGGGSPGATVGLLSSYLKRSSSFKSSLADEFKKLRDVRQSSSRVSTAASVLAFGRSLRECCETIERRQPLTMSFLSFWEREKVRADEELKPFVSQINQISYNNREQTVRELAAHLIKS